MDIINEINNLKEKINNEIEAISFYKELNYICDELKKVMNSYKYDINNEFSLKQYKAFLESFLENRIGYVNNLIVNKNNKSIFDNRCETDYQKLNELKSDISGLLDYIEANFPIIGREVSLEYEKINKYYEEEFNNAQNSFKRRFNLDMGIIKEPVLSVYSDTSSVLRSYINSLEAFKITRVNNIKIFVDNDIKVKELFKRAYETLKDPRVIAAVNELESNYKKEINNSMESICANTNILIVQENMINNGLQLDKIICLEKEKNANYKKIININFNYNSIDELLEIEDYVNKYDIFKEEFYKVLYALIEKEKYIYYKYNVKPIMYYKISEKSRTILEKMFLENIKNNDDLDKEKIIVDLKKNGYIKVIDKCYLDFFDNCNFTIQSSYDTAPIEKNDTLEYNYYKKGNYYPRIDVINKKTGKRVDRVYGFKCNDELFVRFGNIYRLCIHVIGAIKNKDVIYYYNKNGERIKPFKDDSKIIGTILGNYIVSNNEGEYIVDASFNKIMDYCNAKIHRDILVDYTNNNIIMYDSLSRKLSLFDRNFNLIKEISISNIISIDNNPIISLDKKMNMFNDGVVSILINDKKDKYICYYDVINMRRIDYFKTNSETSVYGYSEGVYPYSTDDLVGVGYKNLNGEVVIEPEFYQANPFFDGCAKAYKKFSTEYGFINHQGVCTPKYDIVDYGNNFINVNVSKKRYDVSLEKDGKKYRIVANNNYIIDNNDNIIDINFDEEKNKILTKKEQ